MHGTWRFGSGLRTSIWPEMSPVLVVMWSNITFILHWSFLGARTYRLSFICSLNMTSLCVRQNLFVFMVSAAALYHFLCAFQRETWVSIRSVYKLCTLYRLKVTHAYSNSHTENNLLRKMRRSSGLYPQQWSGVHISLWVSVGIKVPSTSKEKEETLEGGWCCCCPN